MSAVDHGYYACHKSFDWTARRILLEDQLIIGVQMKVFISMLCVFSMAMVGCAKKDDNSSQSDQPNPAPVQGQTKTLEGVPDADVLKTVYQELKLVCGAWATYGSDEIPPVDLQNFFPAQAPGSTFEINLFQASNFNKIFQLKTVVEKLTFDAEIVVRKLDFSFELQIDENGQEAGRKVWPYVEVSPSTTGVIRYETGPVSFGHSQSFPGLVRVGEQKTLEDGSIGPIREENAYHHRLECTVTGNANPGYEGFAH
jgi:hypothetical protein